MHKILCFAALFFCSIFSKAQLAARLDSLLQTTSNQPGCILLIEKNGKVLYEKSNGLADVLKGAKITPESNFRMASVTKQFTAMGILLLEQQHLLSVDDPIGLYLPGLPPAIAKHVLIRHLITHSSGLLDYEELLPVDQKSQVSDIDVLRLLKAHDSTYFSPGTRFRYSNSGFCLLSLIIEKVSHQSFSSFTKQRIFIPLHMNNSVVYEHGAAISNRAMGYAKDSSGKTVFSDQSLTSATKGDGGVYTSANDYLKWIHALQQNKLLNLPQALRRLRFPIGSLPGNYYAAGWFITGHNRQILFHSGSTCGFNNYIIEVPGQKFSVVYFSNMADNVASFKAILKVMKDSGMNDYSNVFNLYDVTN